MTQKDLRNFLSKIIIKKDAPIHVFHFYAGIIMPYVASGYRREGDRSHDGLLYEDRQEILQVGNKRDSTPRFIGLSICLSIG